MLSQIENSQVVLPVHGEGLIEPLCGFYNTNVISLLEESAHSGNYKLLDFINKIKLQRVLINTSLPFYNEQLFFNVNTLNQII